MVPDVHLLSPWKTYGLPSFLSIALKNVDATLCMLAMATGSSGFTFILLSCCSIFFMFSFCESSACSNLALNNACTSSMILISVITVITTTGCLTVHSENDYMILNDRLTVSSNKKDSIKSDSKCSCYLSSIECSKKYECLRN